MHYVVYNFHLPKIADHLYKIVGVQVGSLKYKC